MECCVNRHNGHRLTTVDELEYDHHKLINDLRELSNKMQVARAIDLRILCVHYFIHSNCLACEKVGKHTREIATISGLFFISPITIKNLTNSQKIMKYID